MFKVNIFEKKISVATSNSGYLDHIHYFINNIALFDV